jgi:hypothetical protein
LKPSIRRVRADAIVLVKGRVDRRSEGKVQLLALEVTAFDAASLERPEDQIAGIVYLGYPDTSMPPLAQQTISVTRYLKPGGVTRWCASSTRGLALRRPSAMMRSIKSSMTAAMA